MKERNSRDFLIAIRTRLVRVGELLSLDNVSPAGVAGMDLVLARNTLGGVIGEIDDYEAALPTKVSSGTKATN